YLDNYQGSTTIGIETTSNGGATWNLAFQKSFSSTHKGKITEVISTADVGSSTFQFCLFFNGSSYNMNDYYFDNIMLLSRHNNDATVSTINTSLYNLAGNHTISVDLFNTGLTTINTLEMSYQFNDAPPVIETFSSVNLQTINTKTLSFTQQASVEPGSYTLKVEILKVNGVVDDNPDNNVLTKDFFAATHTGNRRVCIEHFTSSTCGPCVSPNAQMKTLLANNPGKFGITKYQMNWPGSGDPYYTAEGGVRRTYYAVNAVPTIFFNGKTIASVNQSNFNNALNEPAFIDISGSFSIDGNNIMVTGQVDSYIDIPEARLYVIVNEKRTTGNKGSNGETEFFHVMMKMLPNANGETITLQAGGTKFFQHTFNMSSTNVEEMDDLEVHVLVQDYASKYIFNSNFLSDCEVAAPGNFSAQQEGASVILTWDNVSAANTYTLYCNGVLLQENITTTTFTHENVTAGTYTYGVRAMADGCSSNIAETTITICDEDPENFSAQQEDTSVVLTWEADYTDPHSFTLFFNGEVLAENITSKEYIHENVPEGEHTYGLLAVVEECQFNIIETTITILRVNELSNKFKIYPNPANDYLFVEGVEIESIALYNNSGQLVKNVAAAGDIVKINTKDISAGVYFLQIKTTSGMTKTEKIAIKN
ncbi:MAG: T9SS type A sorting domain-containing protein, partial [Lentimicrobiaceae bacterium]|nr:T9SS type A sorting domain-containing protein [Lentimicrobiaceae bacterium]